MYALCSGVYGNGLTGALPGSMVTGVGVAELAFHKDKVYLHSLPMMTYMSEDKTERPNRFTGESGVLHRKGLCGT